MKIAFISVTVSLATFLCAGAHASDGGETAVLSDQLKDQSSSYDSSREKDHGHYQGQSSLEPVATDVQLGALCEKIMQIDGSLSDDCITRSEDGKKNAHAFRRCRVYANWGWAQSALDCLSAINNNGYTPMALDAIEISQENIHKAMTAYDHRRREAAQYGQYFAEEAPYDSESTYQMFEAAANNDYQKEAAETCLEMAKRGAVATLSDCFTVTANKIFENPALLKSCQSASKENRIACLQSLKFRPSEKAMEIKAAWEEAKEIKLRAQRMKDAVIQAEVEKIARDRETSEAARANLIETRRCSKARVIVGRGKIGVDGQPCEQQF